MLGGNEMFDIITITLMNYSIFNKARIWYFYFIVHINTTFSNEQINGDGYTFLFQKSNIYSSVRIILSMI